MRVTPRFVRAVSERSRGLSAFFPSLGAGASSRFPVCPTSRFFSSAATAKFTAGSGEQFPTGEQKSSSPATGEPKAPAGTGIGNQEAGVGKSPSSAEGQNQKSPPPPNSSTKEPAEQNDPLQDKVSELELQLTEQKEKHEDLVAKLRLAYADNENARKRNTTDLTNAKSYAISKFAQSVVEVADNLERALDTVERAAHGDEKASAAENQKVKDEKLAKNPDLKALYDGVKITDETLLKLLKQNGIEKMFPLGEKFDPNLHDAMFQMDSDKPKDTIVHVMQNGWKIKDRMLRAARVGTSKGGPV